MTIHKPYAMQPVTGDADITYTADEVRQSFSGDASQFDGVYAAGTGTSAAAAWKVSQRAAGANFSVDIAAGHCQITGDDAAGQGSYRVWSDAVVNLAVPAAPGSGTLLHRVVLQVRDKLHNGSWTTYDAVPVLVADTGSGTPPEPPSALTLALVSVSAGQASVLNANITDQRPVSGKIRLVKPANTVRISTATLTADPDLQTPWMVPGARYRLAGLLIYDSGTGQNFSWNFSVLGGGGSVSFEYVASFVGVTSGTNLFQEHAAADVVIANGAGVGSNNGIQIQGEATFSAGGPLLLQWAQGTSGAFNTTLHAGSWLELDRLS